MDIYWIQDHERKGPLPEVEVISMLEAGLIPENARAWHAGCPEWVCIRDLPALKGAGAVSREEGRTRRRECRWWFRMRTSVFLAEWLM